MKQTTTSPKYRIFAILLAVLLNSATSFAGDIEAGKAKAVTCLTCHGVGDTVLGVATPIISGQYEDYLIQAMKSYRSGSRNNPVMNSFVNSLSDKDIEDIAAFYSSMDSKLFTPTE